ncbi:hypothetical protein [Psychrosphaera algicola]|uniref:Uncharacterized protein n=1 Tax=Psychrosphaera algicola TaxID=3023714 RepID=A0ABT5FEU8_9GAMM|nr:hypothetical protein [Psychrosphaera sp. G1-22]MDC2889147.1 hypothetical protein [Psychrosphaera sp. G1-22]
MYPLNQYTLAWLIKVMVVTTTVKKLVCKKLAGLIIVAKLKPAQF